jgi:ketosteroid isomerase-like protein
MHVTGALQLSNLATLQRFLDAENARDWATWSSCLHPNATYHAVGSDVVISGADAYAHHMQAAYAELPDWSFSARNTAESGAVIFVEFDGSGHYTGTHRSRVVSGAPLRLQAVCVFEFADGRIFRVREYLDRDGFDRQTDEFLSGSPGI